MPSTVVGVDVGGTKTAVGIATLDGTILRQTVLPTPADAGPDAVIAQIIRGIYEVTEKAGNPLAAVECIGVGIAGATSASRGIVFEAPNMRGWRDVPLRDRLEAELGRPVRIDNDAHAAAWAEYRWGAAQSAKNFVYVTVGTGIGGGIILNGQLYRGAAETAGEIGHTSIDYNGPVCRCGNRGCLELFASGTAIERRAKEELAKGAKSLIATLAARDPAGLSAVTVQRAAKQGDALGCRLFHEAGTFLGIGLANVTNLLSPDLIVVGGGVSTAGDLLLEPARAAIASRALRAPAAVVQVVPSAFPREIGLLGATALALGGMPS